MTRTITFYTLFLWLVFWLPGHAQLPISFTNGLKSYHPFNGDFYAANHNPVHHNKFVSATFGPDSNGITNNSAAFGGTQRINMYKGIIDDDVSSFSVDFWFRATGSGSQVLFWEGQINQQSVWIRIEPGQNRIRAIAGTLTNFVGINTPGMYNTGAWFHFALTAEKVSGAPDTMRTYINGQAMALATGEWSSSSTTNFTRIGTRDNISQHLIGNVDDLRVWSRPLAASEIQALYQQPRIVMGAVPSSAVCAGGTFSLPFTVLGGSFETGNAFHAQLSDDQGSFIYPISIGSLSGTTSGVINVQVPQNISTSSNYRLRIIATHLPRVSENVDTLSFTNPNALPGYDTFARLLMHYPLDGNGNDISGNGNNRSLVNSWQPRSDRFGTDTSAVYFGSSGRMTVGRPYVLDRYHGSTQPISFSFWYKTTAATNAIRDIFTCFSAGANNGLYIGTTPSSRVRFRINGGSSIVEAAYANNNVWTHFACVYTGSQLQIFRNGNLIQSTNSSGSIQITRGAQMGSNSDPFNALAELFGTLDDFRMYGRALNTNEVNLLYDNGHASSNSPFCYQDTVQFMATSFPGLAYNWSGPQAFQSNQQNPVLGPFLNTNQSGNYGLVLSYNGCVGDTNFTPVQPEVPPVVIAPVVNGCIGDTLLVTVSGATSTNHYHWFADSLGTLPIVDSVDQLLLSPLADTVVYVQIQPGGNCLGALTPIPITVLPPPSIGAMANSNSLCTGDTLVLNGTGAQSYIWNQGVVNGQGFAPSSSATYTVVGTDSNGCTDSTSLFVPVFPTSGSTLTTMACDSFVLNGQSYFTTGTYTQVLSNSQGCDSLITLNLTLFNSGTFLDTVVVCAGDSLGFGSQTLTASGNYSETFATVNGCDSVVQLHFVALPPITTNLMTNLCTGDTFFLGSQVLTTGGNYSEVFASSNGCDSTVNLQLNLLPNSVSNITASICTGDTFFLGTQLLTTAGNFSETFTSANGCDSTVLLSLNLLPGSNTNFSTTLCAGDTLLLGSQTLTSSGMYTEVFTALNGCDSTVTVNLSVLSPITSSINANICSGNTFILGGQLLTNSGTFQAVFTATNGCDSTVTLNLNVLAVVSSNVTASICNGDTYTLGNQLLTSSGNYSATFTAVNGCDSTVNLALTVLPTFSSSANLSLCQGDTLTFGTQLLSSAGTYQETFIAANGCDSMATINLSILPVFSSNISSSICDGETIAFGSQTLSATGTYTEVFQAANGCDSVVTLALNVLPTYQVIDSIRLCQGDTYFLGAQTLVSAGTYTELFSTSQGCDSVVSLQVEITNPQISVSLSGDSLVAAFGQADQIQWFDCNSGLPVAGANGSTFRPGVSGTYGAVISLEGCLDSSNCVAVTVVGLNRTTTPSTHSVSIFPNPNSGSFFLKNTSNSSLGTKMILRDLQGAVLQALLITDEQVQEIQLREDLSVGLYYLTFPNGQHPPIKVQVMR